MASGFPRSKPRKRKVDRKRRVVQLTPVVRGDMLHVVALCSDATMWVIVKGEWEEIAPIPQPKGDSNE